jgi:hypothetical protein
MVKHTSVAADYTTYEGAFDVASKIAGTKRKESWRGRVRIKYRKTTGTFEVQVPVLRWLPALAEALAIGDVVRYDKPPKVISACGKDPFDAPGTQGIVVDFSNSTASARVQFQLQKADGAVQYSNLLTVIAGQRCEVNR